MLLQIASDIHIEKKFPIKMEITDFITPMENVDALILPGDVGSIYQYEHLRHFFLSCKRFFQNVVYIPGNNEYYLRDGFPTKTMAELNDDITRLCRETGVVLLNNSFIETDTHVLFGSTWWSFIPNNLCMRVYKEKEVPIDYKDFNYMHFTARKSLDYILAIKPKHKKLIVITHYCPTRFGTMNLHHKKMDFYTLVPYYFSTSEKYLNGMVDSWIFGHTHVFRDFYFDNNGTRLISNADPQKRFFRKNFTIEL